MYICTLHTHIHAELVHLCTHTHIHTHNLCQHRDKGMFIKSTRCKASKCVHITVFVILLLNIGPCTVLASFIKGMMYLHSHNPHSNQYIHMYILAHNIYIVHAYMYNMYMYIAIAT